MKVKYYVLDWPLFFCVFLLTFLGVINFFSASLYLSLVKTGSPYTLFKDFVIKTIFLGFLFFFLGNFLGNFFSRFKFLFFLSFLILYLSLWLILFTPLGLEVNNSKRWMKLGGLIFQPAELIKPFALLVFIFLFFSSHSSSISSKILITLLFLFFLILPIFLEPAGTNSLIIFLSLFSSTLVSFKNFSEMLKFLFPFAFFGLILALVGFIFWPYRQERILSFLTKGKIFEERSFQLNQSIWAIASGGLKGKGLGKSEAKYLLLPQMLNDSIFAIYAEETGVWGPFLFLVLFSFLCYRILTLASFNPSLEKKAFSVGVFSWLVSQTFIHIFSNIGLFVPTGVVLPFFSSGSSAQLAIYFSLGLISSFKK